MADNLDAAYILLIGDAEPIIVPGKLAAMAELRRQTGLGIYGLKGYLDDADADGRVTFGKTTVLTVGNPNPEYSRTKSGEAKRRIRR
ncbi:MAG: hypothetical protein WC962_10425 [Phycisphaerae bacterium]